MKKVEDIFAALYAARVEPTQWRYDPQKGLFVVWCQWQNDIHDVVGTLPAELCAVSLYREKIAGRDMACITFLI